MAVTWNPSDVAAPITLSNGNLTATRDATAAAYAHGRATQSRSTGVYYFESKVTFVNSVGVGLATASQALFGDYLGNTFESVAYFQDGYMQYGPGGAGFGGFLGATYTTNDIIGVLYDPANTTVKLYKNGVLQYTSTVVNFSTPAFPAFHTNASGDAHIGNFGASAFSALPAGATAWGAAPSLIAAPARPIHHLLVR